MGGYATPFFYLYFILKLPSNTSRNEWMLWGFFLGLIIDIFSNTPGMNAAATTFVAFLTPTLLRFFMPRDLLERVTPSLQSMGVFPFVKFSVTALLLHQLTLLSIESFSFSDLSLLLLRGVTSTILTCMCILAVEGIRK